VDAYDGAPPGADHGRSTGCGENFDRLGGQRGHRVGGRVGDLARGQPLQCADRVQAPETGAVGSPEALALGAQDVGADVFGLALGAQDVGAEPGAEGFGDGDGAVGVLVLLDDGGSTAIASFARTRRVLVLWRKSARASRTFRWARAVFAFALARFALPFWQRAMRRW
jgi:hypothetical protein